MPMHIASSIDPDSWDDFTKTNPNSNIFHTRAFADIFQDCSKYTPYTFFLEEDGRPLAAIISIQSKLLGTPFVSYASRAVVYGGILCSDKMNDKYWHKHLGKLIHSYDTSLEKETLFTEIRNINESTHCILPFAKEKYKFIPHLNYILDLTLGEQTLWENLSQGLRKSLRKAQEGTIEVIELTTGDHIEALHSLVSTTYSKVHIPCFDLEIFKKAWNLLSPAGYIRVTLAKDHERLLAARAALIYNGRVFDWFAGSSEQGDAKSANALLAWDMIRWGCQNGAKCFDFGGAGDPNKHYGVREFKMRFGGQLVNYGRFMRIYSTARYMTGSLGYKILRRFLY